MMYRIATFVLLLNFANTMFFHELSLLAPRKTSPYDIQVRETDEVNTIAEFILEYCMGFSNDTPDEDFDNNPDHISCSVDYTMPVFAKAPVVWLALGPAVSPSINFFIPLLFQPPISLPPEATV